jgi:hypothetical protein
MEIMTCDKEWSHEELYGVAYDECMRACRGLDYLLDMKDLDKPNILMELIMDELDEDKNLVDYYDEFYASKDTDDTSDDVFNKWDHWMHDRIQETLYNHKYKHYIGGSQ